MSRLLKQARPDLLPRDDIGRVLLVPGDAVIKLGPLRIRQECRVCFQALPDRIQQVGFSAAERLLIWLRKSLIRLSP